MVLETSENIVGIGHSLFLIDCHDVFSDSRLHHFHFFQLLSEGTGTYCANSSAFDFFFTVYSVSYIFESLLLSKSTEYQFKFRQKGRLKIAYLLNIKRD
jgi:hypothetical protein